MFVNFDEVFFPSQEKQDLWRKTVIDAMNQAVENKECWMCKNTYLSPWNNHGHEDHTRHCKFDNQCVDFSNGKECKNWSPREIDVD